MIFYNINYLYFIYFIIEKKDSNDINGNGKYILYFIVLIWFDSLE